MKLTVAADGRISSVALPAGSEPLMREAAQCIAAGLRAEPALRDGVPVASEVTVPLLFWLHDARDDGGPAPAFARPVLGSRPEQVEAAYRGCYPAGLGREAEVQLAITVTEAGKVRSARILEGSGEPALDAAATCIVRKLRFAPARRNGVNVASQVSWPLWVGPAERLPAARP